MAKLTKQTVAAVSKGKKETVAKPKTTPKTTATKVTKVATKPAVKTPAKTPRTPRKAIVKPAIKTPVKAPAKTEVEAKPVEVSKAPAKVALSPRTKKVETKPRKPRKPRSFKTDTSKFRKYNNELRANLRNLIYDKGYTIAKVAREIGVAPSYLFNILKLNKTPEGGNDSVIVLDIVYAVCRAIGVNISSVLPEAEIVNPIYKSKNDYVVKVKKLQEENVQFNFLYTQTKQQYETQSVKLAASEARVKELEKFLESSINKIDKIREGLTNYSKAQERISKQEESKS